jgi:hypothetical protein
MPGPVLHLGCTVLCAHAGQAMPTVTSPRVLAGGQPVATLGAPWTVAGCTMPPPPAGNGPCVTVQWLVGSTRVLCGGQPLLLAASASTCVPTGTPATPTVFQARVIAT